MDQTAELLAYCAGILDADGHIGVHTNWYKVGNDSKQPTFQPRVQVKQVDPGAVDLFLNLFRGHRYVDRSATHKGSGRPTWVWQIHSAACRSVITAVRPYLRIKDRQADLVLELCELNASPRRHTFVLPPVVDGEPMLPLADAAARAGRSYATAVQCVKLGNIPFVRRPRVRRGDPIIFVPESYVGTWRTRGRGAMRRPEVSARMVAIAEKVKALNSGVRGQTFPSPSRR
jgi:hypothetical protein